MLGHFKEHSKLFPEVYGTATDEYDFPALLGKPEVGKNQTFEQDVKSLNPFMPTLL